MRKVKFALEMNDGIMATNIKELVDNFSIIKIYEHFQSGKLQKWLELRYYDDELEMLQNLVYDCDTFGLEICKILGVEYEALMKTDLDQYVECQRGEEKKIEKRQNKIEKLKRVVPEFVQQMDEETIDLVAFTSLELDNLVRAGNKKIYLYRDFENLESDYFYINSEAKNVEYIGICFPGVIILDRHELKKYPEYGIQISGVDFAVPSDRDEYENAVEKYNNLKVQERSFPTKLISELPRVKKASLITPVFVYKNGMFCYGEKASASSFDTKKSKELLISKDDQNVSFSLNEILKITEKNVSVNIEDIAIDKEKIVVAVSKWKDTDGEAARVPGIFFVIYIDSLSYSVTNVYNVDFDEKACFAEKANSPTRSILDSISSIMNYVPDSLEVKLNSHDIKIDLENEELVMGVGTRSSGINPRYFQIDYKNNRIFKHILEREESNPYYTEMKSEMKMYHGKMFYLTEQGEFLSSSEKYKSNNLIKEMRKISKYHGCVVGAFCVNSYKLFLAIKKDASQITSINKVAVFNMVTGKNEKILETGSDIIELEVANGYLITIQANAIMTYFDIKNEYEKHELKIPDVEFHGLSYDEDNNEILLCMKDSIYIYGH